MARLFIDGIDGMSPAPVPISVDLMRSILDKSLHRRVPFTVAEQRAEQLLKDCLSEEQRLSYELADFFTIKKGRLFPRTYILGRYFHVVKRRTFFGTQTEYCIGYGGFLPYYPWADELLAIKLMIDTDEKRFLRTANRI